MLKSDGEERREFLRAIDAVKKRTQRARQWCSVPVELIPDRRAGQERGLADQHEAVHTAAGSCLSSRQQRILEMSFEGWSVRDISTRLRLSPERVSDEKYKAIQRLREYFSTNG